MFSFSQKKKILPFRIHTFSEGDLCEESKQEVKKLSRLSKEIAENLLGISIHLKTNGYYEALDWQLSKVLSSLRSNCGLLSSLYSN